LNNTPWLAAGWFAKTGNACVSDARKVILIDEFFFKSKTPSMLDLANNNPIDLSAIFHIAEVF